MNQLIGVEKISKAYPSTDTSKSTLKVLENLSFTLLPGEILCILGASGCGKTTALKILSGLELPDAGSVVTDFARPGSKIGFLQQGEKLLPWRNVKQNVALALELQHVSYQEAVNRAEELLAIVGLHAFALSYPSQISGGMKQRALLARLFIYAPKLLLLDEPLSALDIVARRELAEILRTYVRKHNASAVVVTHSVEEAVFIADRVVTLSRLPATIVDHFAFSKEYLQEGAVLLDRTQGFDVILHGLLKAISKQ